jgi:hypothetical protein
LIEEPELAKQLELRTLNLFGFEDWRTSGAGIEEKHAMALLTKYRSGGDTSGAGANDQDVSGAVERSV